MFLRNHPRCSLVACNKVQPGFLAERKPNVSINVLLITNSLENYHGCSFEIFRFDGVPVAPPNAKQQLFTPKVATGNLDVHSD
jgi:hypothetical protein